MNYKREYKKLIKGMKKIFAMRKAGKIDSVESVSKLIELYILHSRQLKEGESDV